MKVQNRHNEFLAHGNELYPRPDEKYHINRKREDTRKTAGHIVRAKHTCILTIAAIAVTVNMILPLRDWIAGNFTTTAASRTSYSIEWRSYTVRRGDTLWAIAERYMGDGMGYHVIANKNNLANPDLIYPNDVLIIPVIHRGQ